MRLNCFGSVQLHLPQLGQGISPIDIYSNSDSISCPSDSLITDSININSSADLSLNFFKIKFKNLNGLSNSFCVSSAKAINFERYSSLFLAFSRSALVIL